jgi:hypothetical protein
MPVNDQNLKKIEEGVALLFKNKWCDNFNPAYFFLRAWLLNSTLFTCSYLFILLLLNPGTCAYKALLLSLSYTPRPSSFKE